MKKLGILIIIYILFVTTEAICAVNGVAKLMKFRGDISFEVPGTGKKGKLKKNMWLPESSIVTSGPKSYAKILFIDKSRLTLGPKSQVVIKKFNKKSAGVINLIKGKIRSQVTKNYMEMKNKGKSKLFITTKNAAMGVRGTDFQVNYDSVNRTTDLITYSGAVAFSRYSGGKPAHQKRDYLESMVSSKNAVMVTKGTFSRASEQEDRPTNAYKLSALQSRKLKNDDTLLGGNSEKTREIVPPGVTSDAMKNDGSELDQEIIISIDNPTITKIDEKIVPHINLSPEPNLEPIGCFPNCAPPPPPPPLLPEWIPPPRPPELPQLGTAIININLIK